MLMMKIRWPLFSVISISRFSTAMASLRLGCCLSRMGYCLPCSRPVRTAHRRPMPLLELASTQYSERRTHGKH